MLYFIPEHSLETFSVPWVSGADRIMWITLTIDITPCFVWVFLISFTWIDSMNPKGFLYREKYAEDVVRVEPEEVNGKIKKNRVICIDKYFKFITQ